MARSPWLAPLAALLVVVMFMTGCMSAAPRRFDDGQTIAHRVDDHDGGAQKAHGGGEAIAALFIIGGIIIVGAVIADLIILPFTAPRHHCFCCTQEVVHVCYH